MQYGFETKCEGDFAFSKIDFLILCSLVHNIRPMLHAINIFGGAGGHSKKLLFCNRMRKLVIHSSAIPSDVCGGGVENLLP